MLFSRLFPLQEKAQFAKDFVLAFTPASYKVPISTCQAFSLRLNDVRRRGNPLYQSPATVFTAVSFQSTMLKDGRKVPSDMQILPVRADKIEEPADEEADQDEQAEMASDFVTAFGEVGSECLLMASKMTMGWATSYRKAEPEKKGFSLWRKRYSRARLRWSGYPLLPARLRRPQAEQLQLQEEWAKRRRIS